MSRNLRRGRELSDPERFRSNWIGSDEQRLSLQGGCVTGGERLRSIEGVAQVADAAKRWGSGKKEKMPPEEG